MYRLYQADQESEGKPFAKMRLYEHIFNTDINIGFFKPKKDQCSLCAEYANYSEEEKKKMEDTIQDHNNNKEISRKMKEQDKKEAQNDPNSVCAVG